MGKHYNIEIRCYMIPEKNFKAFSTELKNKNFEILESLNPKTIKL